MASKDKAPFVARGAQRYRLEKTQVFNIDNGNGITIDDVLFANLATAIRIVSIRPVYTEATDTSGVASATYKVGTTAGGAEICAATALDVSKAVGGYGAAATLVAEVVPAGGSLFCRHTGIAATEGGQYYVQVEYMPMP
jgi:hypothetical protein